MWKAPRQLGRLASALPLPKAALARTGAAVLSAAVTAAPYRALSTASSFTDAVVDSDRFDPVSDIMPSYPVAAAEHKRRLASLVAAKAASNKYPSHHAAIPAAAAAFTAPVQWQDVYHATVRGVRNAPSLALKGQIEYLSALGSAAAPVPAEFATAVNPYRLALTLHRVLETKQVAPEHLRGILSLLTKLPAPAASAAAATGLDLSKPVAEPWVVDTLRALASPDTVFATDAELVERAEQLRQLDVEMSAVTAFAQQCARDYAFAAVRILHRLYKDFATPNAADVAPVLRMLARVGFHKDVATSVVYLLEEGVATHEAFHVAIESANAAGEHTTVRALRNLYAATFDLPLDEALPKLPAATAQALIESNQSAALNSYSLYNKDPKGEALQTYNRAVQEGTFAHWHRGSSPADAFADAPAGSDKSPMVTVSLTGLTSPHAMATAVVYSLARIAKASAALPVAKPAVADLVFKLPTAAGVAAHFATPAAKQNAFASLATDASLRKEVATMVSAAPQELQSLLSDSSLVIKASEMLNTMRLLLSVVQGASSDTGMTADEANARSDLLRLETEFTGLCKEIAAATSVGATQQWNYTSLLAAARARAAETGVSVSELDKLATLSPTATTDAVSLVSLLAATTPVDFADASHVAAEARSLVGNFLRQYNGLPPLAGHDVATSGASTPFNASLDRPLSVAQTLKALAPLAPMQEALPETAEALAVLRGDVARFQGSTAVEQASKRAVARVLEELELQYVMDDATGVLVVPKESVRYYVHQVKSQDE